KYGPNEKRGPKVPNDGKTVFDGRPKSAIPAWSTTHTPNTSRHGPHRPPGMPHTNVCDGKVRSSSVRVSKVRVAVWRPARGLRQVPDSGSIRRPAKGSSRVNPRHWSISV